MHLLAYAWVWVYWAGLKYFAYISLPSSGSQFSYQAITLGRRVGERLRLQAAFGPSLMPLPG